MLFVLVALLVTVLAIRIVNDADGYRDGVRGSRCLSEGPESLTLDGIRRA